MPPELVKISRLACGARIVTERVDDARSVAVGCYVGVGTRDEPAKIIGVSHFLEHLLFKGTATRSARDIAESVDATGGDMNAYTTKEFTAFYLRLPARHLDFGVDLLCDVISNPAFDDDEFASERQVILEELHLQQDEPDDLVHTLLYEQLYPKHPLGWEIAGNAATIKATTPALVRRFHRRWYAPPNLIFAAAGPIEHRDFVAAVRSRVRAAGDGVDRVQRRRPRVQTAASTITRRPSESLHLALGWPGVDYTDDDRFALAVLNQVLGAGMSSRLFQTIREERGLAYSVFSAATSYTDSGVLTVYAGTTPDASRVVLELIASIVGAVARDGVTRRELELAKSALEGATVMQLEDTGARMSRLGLSVLTRDRVVPVERYLARLRSVKQHDVQRVARRVFARAPSMAAVGPTNSRKLAWTS